MKLTLDNIAFVKRLVNNGKTYEWFVSMKSHRVSDSRQFVNYKLNSKGRMCTDADAEYPLEWLPKTVQKFIARNDEVEVELNEALKMDGFQQFKIGGAV